MSEQPLREALVHIKAEMDKRSEEGEAHLFLNIPYWDLEELLAVHPEMPDAGEVAAKVIREHEARPMGCLCGAQIGDSIDRVWHLVNQAVAAARQPADRSRSTS